MLQQLYIKNYALLEELRLDFTNDFIILTGETGAGKSILVDAFGLLLGDRAASEVVRTGAETARVEGIFDIFNRTDLIQRMRDLGVDVEDEQTLIITREISRSGRNRSFINGNQTTVNVLKAIGDQLADLHSQHEHQSLFSLETQRDYLDNFGNLLLLRSETAAAYKTYQSLASDLKKRKQNIQRMREQLDLYQFQLKEIDAANFYEDEEDELLQEERLLENVEVLYEHTHASYQALYADDMSIMSKMTDIREAFERITQIDPSMKETLENHHAAHVLLEEISITLQKYLSKLEFDPDRMETIRQRLNIIRGFKKRYQVATLAEIVEFGGNLRQKITEIEQADENLGTLQSETNQAQLVYSEKAIELSQKRQEASENIQQRVERVLADLGMKARFEIVVIPTPEHKGSVLWNDKSYAGDETGMDRVEFMLSANVGEDLAPLIKVASGGEISRTMLALKSVMAEIDPVPTLIFDEIDTGISGRIADAVGEKLQNLASSHQVICITHLPQIAAKGTVHYSVRKVETDGRTKTIIEKLTPQARIEEIAMLMGGDGEISRQHARELLNKTIT